MMCGRVTGGAGDFTSDIIPGGARREEVPSNQESDTFLALSDILVCVPARCMNCNSGTRFSSTGRLSASASCIIPWAGCVMGWREVEPACIVRICEGVASSLLAATDSMAGKGDVCRPDVI